MTNLYVVEGDRERARAKTAAAHAARHVQNGPTAGALYHAAQGSNEDLLFAIHLILQREDTAP